MCKNKRTIPDTAVKTILSLIIFAVVLILLNTWYIVRNLDISFEYASPAKTKITLGHDCDRDLFTKEKMVLRTYELPAKTYPEKVVFSIPAVKKEIAGIYIQIDHAPAGMILQKLFSGDRKKVYSLDFLYNNLLPAKNLSVQNKIARVTTPGTLRLPLNFGKTIKVHHRILYGNLFISIILAISLSLAFFIFCKVEFTKEKLPSLLFIFCGLVLLILPLTRIDLYSRISTENRFLNPFPLLCKNGIFNRKFPGEFEKYLNDRFFPRDALIELDRKVFALNYFDSENRKLSQADTSLAFWGKNMWMFCKIFNTIEMMQNKNLFSDDELKICAERVNALEKKFREKFKAKVYILLVPDKERIYEEYYPDHLLKQRVNTLSRMEQLYGYLKKHTNVKIICPVEKLKEAKKKHIVYYMTGTHCTYRGAEILANELLKKIGEDFPEAKEQQKLNPVKWHVQKKADVDIAALLGYTNPYKELPDALLINEEPIFTVFAKPTCIQQSIPLSLFVYNHKTPEKYAAKGLKTLTFTDSFWNYITPFLVPAVSNQLHFFYGIGKNFVIDSFDEEITKFHPDIVVIQCAERFLDRFLYLK